MASDELQELSAAVRADDAAAVARILERHPRLKATLDDPLPGESFGTVALQVAVRHANRLMIDVLLDAGANINQRSHWWAGGFGVLDDADKADWLADYLISRGATLDATAAAQLGRLDDLERLVEADPAAVHERGGDGQTPLHRARSVEMAAFLLDHGADIDALDVDHESTPSQYLVGDRPDVTRYLISRGCQTDILMAASVGDAPLVRRHLEQNAAAIRTSVDRTWFPMRNPHAGGTIYIWTIGAHRTAQLIAHDSGQSEIEQMLIAASDDPWILAMACETGDQATVDRLLGGDPGLARRLDESDRRRLVACAEMGKTDAVRLMLAAGWPAQTATADHVTALHWAGFHGDATMARYLIAARAPLEGRDSTHKATPIEWTLWGSMNGWRRQTGDYARTVGALLDAGAARPRLTERLVASDAVRRVLAEKKQDT